MRRIVKRVSKAFDKALALNSKQRQGGFTLVELAIVIAVAAILIAAIIYGAGVLSTNAKVNRAMEFTKAIHNAAAVCNIRNPGAFNSQLDATRFSNMVRDSQCRIANPDGQGLIPSGVSEKTLPPGVTNFAVSYNTTTGRVIVTYTIANLKLAEAMYAELKRNYPEAQITNQNNTVTITIPMAL